MIRRLSLFVGAVLLASCGATSTPNTAPSASASATTNVAPAVSASVAASSSVAPAPSAPPTHVVFTLDVLRAPTKASLGVALEVPTSWSIKDHPNLGPTLQSCTSGAEMLGTSVHLSAEACEDGEEGAACVTRIVGAPREGTTTTKDESKDPLRRWVERSRVGKSSWPTYEGKLYAYDAAHRAVVSCGYNFSLEPESRRAAYAKVCDTLAFAPAPGKPGDVPPRAATPDGENGNVSDFPHGDAMSAAALGFFDALSKHDVAAASTFIVGPEDCDVLVPKPQVPACKQQMTKAEFEKNFDTIAKGFPPFESAGSTVLMSMAEGEKKPKAKAGAPDIEMFIVYVLDKAKPCETSEVGVPVAMIGERAKVLILTKAKSKE